MLVCKTLKLLALRSRAFEGGSTSNPIYPAQRGLKPTASGGSNHGVPQTTQGGDATKGNPKPDPKEPKKVKETNWVRKANAKISISRKCITDARTLEKVATKSKVDGKK